jgi:hypothetical protein
VTGIGTLAFSWVNTLFGMVEEECGGTPGDKRSEASHSRRSPAGALEVWIRPRPYIRRYQYSRSPVSPTCGTFM